MRCFVFQLQILPAKMHAKPHPGVQHLDSEEDPLPFQEVHPAVQRVQGHGVQPQAEVPDEPGDAAALPLRRALPSR